MSKRILSQFPDQMNVALTGASGGIGHALLEHLLNDPQIGHITAFSRRKIQLSHEKLSCAEIDISNEASIAAASQAITGELHLILIASGLLNVPAHNMPEKALRDLNMTAFQESFAINTVGPALIAKYFMPKMARGGRSVFAALSARVGSISDNQLGGWYSYRASKAALNMVIKTLSIEVARTHKNTLVIGLHPGTVDTSLSAPHSKNIQHEIFTPDQAAGYLLNVINTAPIDQSGGCLDYSGKVIPP
ncbi:MAG: SDR family NAD(P)-dependent oxidoreductase [Alphaproteobacteria bacterium]|nr:SDR family NAD(P)-dependent oxidoreductase [Alphaproteobacteria bacterium]